MKTILEAPMAFDRVSTHEELHQVLALLSEPGSSVAAEVHTESDEKNSLQEATSDLWLDSSTEEEHDEMESDLQGELYRWAETIAGKSERIN